MTTPIYVDNNATTRVAPEVVETMLPYFSESYGNPSSMHSFGAAAGDGLAKAREQVAELLGVRTPSEIIFTSGTPAAINLVGVSVIGMALAVIKTARLS